MPTPGTNSGLHLEYFVLSLIYYMPYVWNGHTSVSCVELRDLNNPVLHDYVFMHQHHFPPHQPELQQPNKQINDVQSHHRIENQPEVHVLDAKIKSLSRNHAASLAKAARQISSRESAELPKRARWLVIAVGFILFGMSIILVGVTLKLSPMIDEIVRKEHEDLLKKMNQSIIGYHVPVSRSGGNSSAGEIDSSGLVELTEVHHVDGHTHSTESPRSPEG